MDLKCMSRTALAQIVSLYFFLTRSSTSYIREMTMHTVTPYHIQDSTTNGAPILGELVRLGRRYRYDVGRLRYE